MKNWLTWLLIVTVLFLSACLVHSTHVMKEHSRQLRWLVENCNL